MIVKNIKKLVLWVLFVFCLILTLGAWLNFFVSGILMTVVTVCCIPKVQEVLSKKLILPIRIIMPIIMLIVAMLIIPSTEITEAVVENTNIEDIEQKEDLNTSMNQNQTSEPDNELAIENTGNEEAVQEENNREEIPIKEELTTEITSEPAKEIELTESEKIEEYVTNIIEEQYSKTVINDIVINEHLGTEQEDDYIALVYLTWDVMNSGKSSKEMISMYSGDLAARVAVDLANVQEIAIFWTVPYLSSQSNIAKFSYERKGTGMYKMDIMLSNVFN